VRSDQTRARLEAELGALAAERSRLLWLAAAPDGRDAADQAERALREFDIDQVDMRMRRLGDRLRAASKPRPAVKNDGTVREGAVVLLDFGDGDAERYVVGSLAELDEDVNAVTPTSPLGRALLGTARGSTVRYRTPAGERSVVVVGVGDSAEDPLARDRESLAS